MLLFAKLKTLVSGLSASIVHQFSFGGKVLTPFNPANKHSTFNCELNISFLNFLSMWPTEKELNFMSGHITLIQAVVFEISLERFGMSNGSVKAETHYAINRCDKSPRLHYCCDKASCAYFVTAIQNSNQFEFVWQIAATMIFTCHTRRFVATTCCSDVSQRFVA